MNSNDTKTVTLRALTAPWPAHLLTFIADCRAHDDLHFDVTQTERALKELLAHPDSARLWLVQRSGRDVGYLILSFGFSLEFGGRDAFLDELYVEPAARGQGVATRAMDLAAAAMANLELQAVHLEVHRDNHNAQRLYRKLGWQPREQFFLMSRYLTPPSAVPAS